MGGGEHCPTCPPHRISLSLSALFVQQLHSAFPHTADSHRYTHIAHARTHALLPLSHSLSASLSLSHPHDHTHPRSFAELCVRGARSTTPSFSGPPLPNGTKTVIIRLNNNIIEWGFFFRLSSFWYRRPDMSAKISR